MKKILILCFVAVVLSVFSLWFCNWYINRQVRDRIFSDATGIPANHVGLLLGTSKYLRDGHTLNPYYIYRIEAAEALLKTHKINYLVISGDNSRKSYNEPEDMRQSLIALGIDSNRIFLDYAGFRTFDSVVRLREIFGQYQVTIISQAFHNERAVYIARREGIDAIGYNARDVGKRFGMMVMLREKFARVKVFVDYLTFKQPKFLGPKVRIPAV
jgi:SanA protein